MTTIDQFGRANVADVHEGGLWHFPSGMPHSLQGVGEDGGEFIIVFDDGKATGFNTLLVTDWVAHTPARRLGSQSRRPWRSLQQNSVACPVAQHFNIDPTAIAQFPRNKPVVVPV